MAEASPDSQISKSQISEIQSALRDKDFERALDLIQRAHGLDPKNELIAKLDVEAQCGGSELKTQLATGQSAATVIRLEGAFADVVNRPLKGRLNEHRRFGSGGRQRNQNAAGAQFRLSGPKWPSSGLG